MTKLMKYEFRKTRFSKLVILSVTAVLEVLFLIGVLGKFNTPTAIGTMGLVLAASIGIFYIGMESILVFHRDLNTKQSYMLFLIPKNSYQILGAKILENGLSLLMAGLFFFLLAVADVTTLYARVGGLKQLTDMATQVLHSFHIPVELSWKNVLLIFATIIISWLFTIVTADFALVLSATFFAGRKFSGLVSFLIFLAVDILAARLGNLLNFQKTFVGTCLFLIFFQLAASVLVYLAAGRIMERKLSV